MRALNAVLLIAVSMGIAYAIVQEWWGVVAVGFLIGFLATVLFPPSPPKDRVLRLWAYPRDE